MSTFHLLFPVVPVVGPDEALPGVGGVPRVTYEGTVQPAIVGDARKMESSSTRFTVSLAHGPFDGISPFVFATDDETFVVDSRLVGADESIECLHWTGTDSADDVPFQRTGPFRQYTFRRHLHDGIEAIVQAFDRGGTELLYGLSRNTDPSEGPLSLDESESTLWRTFALRAPWIDNVQRPKHTLDFRPDGAYSVYNWEIFYHLPSLIARYLADANRYSAAVRWLRAIFDPFVRGGASTASEQWRFPPLRGSATSSLAGLLSSNAEERREATRALSQQLAASARDPFDPHAIAALRPDAYRRATLIQMVQTLIAWGDDLFRRYTAETIGEATLIYANAARILGPRPVLAGAAPKNAARTFHQLWSSGELGEEDWMLAAEAMLPAVPDADVLDLDDDADGGDLPLSLHPYFRIPPNENLLGLWDTVGDRLFKIRHCLDIDGADRDLAIFEPPIDPGVLVRAVAAGLNIADVLRDLQLPPSTPYRFPTLLRRARDLAASTQRLGADLQRAIEQRDAEALARLRSDHEIAAMSDARTLIEARLREADEALRAQDAELATIRQRKEYYEGRPLMNAGEKTAIGLNSAALGLSVVALALRLAAAPQRAIPDFTAGGAGIASPVAVAKVKGDGGGRVMTGMADALSTSTQYLSASAAIAQTVGSYQRRMDDWKFMAKQAASDETRALRGRAAAEIRKELVRLELENHDRTRERSVEIRDFLNSKYSNQELYAWLGRELRGLHQQSYQLALQTARAAEAALNRELDASVGRFAGSMWDASYDGLLAGNKLQLAIDRLENDWLERNTRDRGEIAQDIPVSLVDPLALAVLKGTGSCEISIPEIFFDLDYPGYYRRRIRSVAVTIVSTSGPLQVVPGKLVLTNAFVRDEETRDAETMFADATDANHFGFGARAITLSTGRRDAGIQPGTGGDDRYLPFEGAGAVSKWTLSIESKHNGVAREAIADVVLHLTYSAERPATVEDTVRAAIASLQSAARAALIDVTQVFADEVNAAIAAWETGDDFITIPVEFLREHIPHAPNASFALLNVTFVALAAGSATESTVDGGTAVPFLPIGTDPLMPPYLSAHDVTGTPLAIGPLAGVSAAITMPFTSEDSFETLPRVFAVIQWRVSP